jgi:hypothetical protein
VLAIDSSIYLKKVDVLKQDSLFANQISVFKNQTLKVTHINPIFNAQKTNYWPGIILFFVFSIYIFISLSDKKKIISIFGSVFRIQEAKLFFRDELRLSKRISIFFGIAFLLIMAFLLQIANHYFGLIFANYLFLHQYVIFAFLVGFLYLIKYLIVKLSSYIVLKIDLGKEYLFNVFIFSQSMSMVVFPLVICLAFSKFPAEWFLYPALIICLGFYVLRLIRGFIISITEQNIGILYIFLYLCALEILPSIVLVKFLLVNF